MKIGVVMNIMQDSTSPAPRYADIRGMAQAAEAAGFDSIWLFDHLLFRSPGSPTLGIWECWTLLTALAEATTRVELGTLVLCNPFRNPALLAKMAHTLDEVSGGRLILGLGAGWNWPEFEAFGFSYAQRVDRFEEALQIVKPLLHTGHVDFRGTHYQAPNCEIVPPGPRRDGIPMLVGAFGPRMLRLAARHADLWNTAWVGQPHELAPRLSDLRAACADVGRDPATLPVTVGVQAIFPDLGRPESWTREPLMGSADELAAGLRGFADAGVSHLIVRCSPDGPAALARLAEAVQRQRHA